MSADPACQAPSAPAGAVPRTCVPFAHVPAVPVVAVPYVPVPVPSGLPVMSVSGVLPDRAGNVDVTQFLDGWAAWALAGKADKAPPSAAGNLASLGPDGNLADSGKSPSDFAPASGIAKSALDASVQASLGMADSAVQPGSLFDGGLIKSGLLPSYVDDVLEYSAYGGFPQSGEAGKIYVAKDVNRTYRWSGSQYVEVAASPVTSVNGRTGAVVLDIPDAVTVDSTLSGDSANPVQNRVVNAALGGKRGLTDLAVYAAGDAWACAAGSASYRLSLVSRPSSSVAMWASGPDPGASVVLLRTDVAWVLTPPGGAGETMYDENTGWDANTRNLEFDIDGVTWSLVYDDAVVPTGGSLATVSEVPAPSSALPQMDGTASSGSGSEYSRVDHVHPSDTDKADKVSGATAGNLASLDSSGNLADSGAKPSDFAAKADLPYRLVEPGKWEFSDGLSHEITGPRQAYDSMTQSHFWLYVSGNYASQRFDSEELAISTLFISFSSTSGDTFTATRASLPGHLCDRAGNRVVVTGDTTLTLPAANPGYLRDFLVRLEISGSTVPTITFAATTGETIVYETDGDEFPVPDEAGTWLYSFTENCVSHKFAVSLKKVNEVAAPQAQGGS